MNNNYNRTTSADALVIFCVTGDGAFFTREDAVEADGNRHNPIRVETTT